MSGTVKKPITLPAHFDGNSIVLDIPYKLNSSDKLLITILEPDSETSGQDDWAFSSLLQLSRAYSDDEVKYTRSIIKEPNPDYNK